MLSISRRRLFAPPPECIVLVMKVWGRRALKGSVAMVFLLGVVLLLRSARFSNWLQAELSARTGSTVRLTNLRFSFPLSVAAENVQIAKAGFFSLQSERLLLVVNPFELAANTIHRVQLEKPRL